MKIGVISDTHLRGYDERLARILHEPFRDVDMIMHAGDLVDEAVLDIFAPRDVRAVCGNMDPPSVRDILPEYLLLEIEGYKVALIHGWGSPFGIERRLLEKVGMVDCLIYGHTHQPMNEKRDGVLFFNPGSATDRRFANADTVGIITFGAEITAEIITLEASATDW